MVFRWKLFFSKLLCAIDVSYSLLMLAQIRVFRRQCAHYLDHLWLLSVRAHRRLLQLLERFDIHKLLELLHFVECNPYRLLFVSVLGHENLSVQLLCFKQLLISSFGLHTQLELIILQQHLDIILDDQ